jgi:hypothetical protein
MRDLADRQRQSQGIDTARDNVYTEWDEVNQFAGGLVRDWFPETWKDRERERVPKVGGWFSRR